MSKIQHISHRLRSLGYFCVLVAALLFFFGTVSPRIVSISPPMQRFGDVQELLGIHSGLMYYTDLKTQQETQDYVRYALEQSSK